MLRPDRMSRVSVTGTKRVMVDVIGALYELNLVDLVDYDGAWEGFDPGDPIEPADEASERLVTVRSIESILGVDDDDYDASGTNVTDEDIEAELADVRAEVNALDDRRNELREALRDVEDAVESAAPFVDVGIDLDLLSGYDSLVVRVGEGDAAAVSQALAEADGVDAFEVFDGDETVAAFVHPADEDAVDEALVGVGLATVEVPDAEGSPEEYLASLEAEREEIESDLEAVQDEIESLKTDAARFLLAAEERLTIEVQKAEAPLRFATTRNAFLAEGWIPTDRYEDLAAAVESAAGDHAEVEELERVGYSEEGVPEHSEAATDGGTEMAMNEAGPPVIQDNPAATRPFELLVRTISRPRYSELDPTFFVFLTFPTFFGFMIGDLGYGIFYALVGYLMFTRFDSPGLKSLGGVAIWSGFFTMVFGVLYGEIFGLHVLGDVVWGGHPPIEKGLNVLEFALLWLFLAMIIGLVHVGTGYVLDFVNTAQHSVKDAVLESASWFMLMFGVWIWILSRHMQSAKPDFIFELSYHDHVIFSGLPASVGIAALAVGAVGLVLMLYDEYRHLGGVAAIVGPLESLNVLVNVLSYARITAVLLAKAGMAFVVNLLFFGVYEHDGEVHFMINETPAHVAAEYGAEAITFPGLVHGGVAAIVGGLLVLVIGHAVVWSLGITSAGLQAIRLEYVEFFQKFYEGGGEPYTPFGYRRT